MPHRHRCPYGPWTRRRAKEEAPVDVGDVEHRVGHVAGPEQGAVYDGLSVLPAHRTTATTNSRSSMIVCPTLLRTVLPRGHPFPPAPGHHGLGVAGGSAGQHEVGLLCEDDGPGPAHPTVADAGGDQQPLSLLLAAGAGHSPGTHRWSPSFPVISMTALSPPGPWQTPLPLRPHRPPLPHLSLAPVSPISPWHSSCARSARYSIHPWDAVQPVPAMHPVHTGLSGKPIPAVEPLQPRDPTLAFRTSWPLYPGGSSVAAVPLGPQRPLLSPQSLAPLEPRVTRGASQTLLTRRTVLLGLGAEVLDCFNLVDTVRLVKAVTYSSINSFWIIEHHPTSKLQKSNICCLN